MRKLLTLVTFAVLLWSCEEKETNFKSEVSFTITEKTASNERVASANEDIPSQILISVKDESGTFILENEIIEITEFSGEYISDPVLMEVGGYEVDKFLVLNDSSEVIYATPKAGSLFESFVNNPLPFGFSVSSDQAAEVGLEVIATNEIDPEDLGYSTFAFSIIPTQDILLSLLGYVASEGQVNLLEGNITVFGDSDSLFTQNIGDSINVVRLRTNYNTIKISARSTGYQTNEIVLSTSSLDQYRTKPLDIELLPVGGLMAYFPFSGNANEVLTNNDNFTNTGAVLSSDSSITANEAYLFDGVDDVINYGDVYDLDTNSFTVTAWVQVYNFDGLIGGTNTRGAEIVNKGLTRYGSPSRAGYGLKAQELNGENVFGFFIGTGDNVYFTRSGSFNSYQWYSVVGRKTNGLIELFVNGNKVSETAIPQNANVNTNIPFTIGSIDKLGNDSAGTNYFEGKIDEVKIFDRSLSDQEISDIYYSTF